MEQQKEQDKIAEEMIAVAQHIKDNSLLANRILKLDNKVFFIYLEFIYTYVPNVYANPS